MKTIKIAFDNIVDLRKFEGSLNFLGLQHKIDDDKKEIELEASAIRAPYKIEVSNSFTSVTFRGQEAN